MAPFMGVRGVPMPLASEAALLKGCSAGPSRDGLEEGCSVLSSANWEWGLVPEGEVAWGLCMSLRLL